MTGSKLFNKVIGKSDNLSFDTMCYEIEDAIETRPAFGEFSESIKVALRNPSVEIALENFVKKLLKAMDD